ncbi:MAG: hypothetical protein R2855_04910 [Thermomicrobiales bacterium]
MDGAVGRDAVALICALFQIAGCRAPGDDGGRVISSQIDAYQREIDQHFGLV